MGEGTDSKGDLSLAEVFVVSRDLALLTVTPVLLLTSITK